MIVDSLDEVSTNLSRGTAAGRWCGFGPYYAMFPVQFALRQIEAFARQNGRVLDPFCGRGTVPFVSQITGREALGSDFNPVAWLYSTVKINPAENPEKLLDRVREILASVEQEDRIPENEFQQWAWHVDVLGFLNAARRILNWRSDVVDATLMGTILVHLHAKLGEGLSNQLRQSKSMSPDYAVRWWQARGMKPPALDIFNFFEKKLAWRYAKGVPVKKAEAKVLFGDARNVLEAHADFYADFILTSPPYCGVTNYEYDNWIRLWMLGGECSPKVGAAKKFKNRKDYTELLRGVFGSSKKASKDDVTVYIRTDARSFTLDTTVRAAMDAWPNHDLFCKYDRAAGPTQTALFGNKWNKAGEVDLLLMKSPIRTPSGFHSLTNWGSSESPGLDMRLSKTEQSSEIEDVAAF